MTVYSIGEPLLSAASLQNMKQLHGTAAVLTNDVLSKALHIMQPVSCEM